MPATERRTWTSRSVVVGLVCFGAVWAMASYQQRYGLSGLAADREAVRAWLAGDELYPYGSPGTALSPVAALLLAPATVLPLTVLGRLIGLGGLAALILSLVALAGPIARRYGRPRRPVIVLAVALALCTGPVRASLGLGDVDLILFGLLTADIVALRRNAWARSRAAWWPGPPASRPPRGRFPADMLRRWWSTGAWAGFGIGVATTLAVSPILFVAYLALTRQWRAAFTALITAGTLLTGALLIAPDATVTWLGSVLTHLDRSGPIGAPENQSLAGVLARLYDSAGTPVLVWFSFSVLLVAVGLIRARSAHADGDEIAAFTVIGLTGAAVGPVSPTQELIWLVPAVLILIDAAARRRVTARPPRPRRFTGVGHAGAALMVLAICTVDPRWTQPWNACAFAVIVLLNALPWRPGVAPALPTTPPRPRPVQRVPAIPGPRGS